MKTYTFNRPAFTMLELVFVIVVLGILAAMALPRIDRDLRQEAENEILSSIRYTQHLAINDFKHISNDSRWQRRFWKVMFANCSDGTDFYRIGSDNDMQSAGTFSADEAARDPLNGKPLYMANNGNCDAAGTNENILIGRRFGVRLTSSTGGCPNVDHVGFDHLGRPHVGFGGSNSANYASYMQQQCNLTFTMSDNETFVIAIDPETGYAEVVNRS